MRDIILHFHTRQYAQVLKDVPLFVRFQKLVNVSSLPSNSCHKTTAPMLRWPSLLCHFLFDFLWTVDKLETLFMELPSPKRPIFVLSWATVLNLSCQSHLSSNFLYLLINCHWYQKHWNSLHSASFVFGLADSTCNVRRLSFDLFWTLLYDHNPLHTHETNNLLWWRVTWSFF